MAKKERTRDTAADFARRSNAISRMRPPPQDMAPYMGLDPSVSERPMPRPSRGMESSPRPMTRPDDLAERAERRKAEDAAGAALRASRREAADMDMQNFVEGGMVRGCKPGQMSGKKFSGTF